MHFTNSHVFQVCVYRLPLFPSSSPFPLPCLLSTRIPCVLGSSYIFSKTNVLRDLVLFAHILVCKPLMLMDSWQALVLFINLLKHHCIHQSFNPAFYARGRVEEKGRTRSTRTWKTWKTGKLRVRQKRRYWERKSEQWIRRRRGRNSCTWKAGKTIKMQMETAKY